jgi:hypothetical protein
MNKNPIDRLFKQKLKGSAEPYPAHLWEGISQRINADGGDNRGGGLWIRWSALGLFLLLAIPIGYYTIQWMGDGSSIEAINNAQEVSISQQDVSSNSTQSASVNATTKTDNLGNDNQIGGVALNASETEEQKRGTITQKGITTNNEQSKFAGTQLLGNQQQNRASGNKNLLNTTAFSTGTNVSEGSQTVLSGRTMTSGSHEASPSNTNINSGAGQDGNLMRSNRTLLNAEKCPSLDRRNIIESIEEKKARNIREAVADLDGWTKRKFYGQWSLALVYGPDVYFRELDPKKEESIGLANHRSDHERFVNAFTTGIEVRMKARKWSLHTGLHYAQITERNNYILDNSEKVINDVKRTGVLERSIVNRYKMIEVPVLLGYEVSRGPWALEVNAGANFGVNLSTDGEIFDEATLTYQDLGSKDGIDPFKKNAGTSLQGGLMLSYKTGYFSSVFVRPYYKQYLNPLTTDEYALDQKYSNVGIIAGYRIML